MFKNGVQGNELAIPASVTVSVTISQFFAIFIAVATQDDLITSLNLVFEGYSSDLTLAFNGASLWKWVLAVVAYIIEGSLGLFVTFLLIVTSHEVVELLLNFTAVEFVSLLDNVAFLLAKKGFMGTENRSEAMLISKTKYRVTTERKSNPFQRIISLGGIAFMLLSGWAIIFARQLWGVYLPNQITVQFEDTLSRELGTYSGTYYRENDPWKFDQERVRYISASGRGQFQYCLESRFWTFSAEENPDPCHNFLAKSSQTLAFDLTETLTLPWLATESLEEPRFYPMSYFYLALGCVQDYDCGGIGHGTCHHNQCTCNDKYFGIRCDYFEETTCEKLDVEFLPTNIREVVSSQFTTKFFAVETTNS